MDEPEWPTDVVVGPEWAWEDLPLEVVIDLHVPPGMAYVVPRGLEGQLFDCPTDPQDPDYQPTATVTITGL
jgi:hypothetical protein